MGVAAVNATLNVAAITNAQIDQKLASRDKPFITPFIRPKSGYEWPMLTDADKLAIQRVIPEIREISKTANLWIVDSVQFEDIKADNVDIVSISDNYLDTTGRLILAGRFFNNTDFKQYRPVAIIDQMLADVLFPKQSPLNQAIYASGNRLIVVGVVETKTNRESSFQSSGTLWIPQPLASSITHYYFDVFQISAHQLEDIPTIETKVKQVLEKRYPQAIVITNSNAKDLLKERELQKTSSRALAGVGLIALGIGGIGIANITIAAVLERTKEIGLRRAIGATQFEIMLQFILEAVILSVLGGTVAIATVHGLTVLTTTTVIQAPYQFSPRTAALSMGAAIVVGVGSSFFPALRATRIDVVTALRE